MLIRDESQLFKQMCDVILKPHVLIGVAAFIFFSVMQHRHHIILAGLRSGTVSEAKSDSSKYYKIPNGLWFNYADCPHYFCEVMIYVSFIIVCEGGYPLLYAAYLDGCFLGL